MSIRPVPGRLTGAILTRIRFPQTATANPMPPPSSGPHRYFFTLYALEAQAPVEPGMTKNLLLQEIAGHILGEGQLMGTYER